MAPQTKMKSLMDNRVMEIKTLCELGSKKFRGINQIVEITEMISSEYSGNNPVMIHLMKKLEMFLLPLINFTDEMEKIGFTDNIDESNIFQWLELGEGFTQKMIEPTPRTEIKEPLFVPKQESKVVHQSPPPAKEPVVDPEPQQNIASTIQNTISLNRRQLPKQRVFNISDEFHCVISHVDSPQLFYVIPSEIYEQYKRFSNYLDNFYFPQKQCFTAKTQILNSDFKYFAVLRLWGERVWFRVEISNPMPNSSDLMELFCIDTGQTIITSFQFLFPLTDEFIGCPPLAYRCCLDLIEPAPQDDGEWSTSAREYLEKYKYLFCHATILEIRPNILIVELIHNGVILSMDFALTFSKRISDKREDRSLNIDLNVSKLNQICDKPNVTFEDVPSDVENTSYKNQAERCTSSVNFKSETYFEPKASNVPSDSMKSHYQEEDDDSDVEISLVGSNYDDEKMICPFYQGPPDTTCFKGDDCTKLHVQKNKDGWTVIKSPISIIPEPLLPSEKSTMTVRVTNVISFKTLYIQIIDTTDSFGAVKNVRNDNLELITKEMNKLTFNKSMPKMDYLPAIGEFVIAKSPDEKWQRAMVVSLEEPYVEVFFVDYGTKSTFHMQELRKIKDDHCNIPKQAIFCILSDIHSVKDGAKDLVTEVLSNLILNKIFDAKINFINHGNNIMEVTLYDDRGKDTIKELGEATKLFSMKSPQPKNQINISQICSNPFPG